MSLWPLNRVQIPQSALYMQSPKANTNTQNLNDFTKSYKVQENANVRPGGKEAEAGDVSRTSINYLSLTSVRNSIMWLCPVKCLN